LNAVPSFETFVQKYIDGAGQPTEIRVVNLQSDAQPNMVDLANPFLVGTSPFRASAQAFATAIHFAKARERKASSPAMATCT
jgi:hypothetical protein